MFHRLRSNFQLSIITLMGGCAVVGITPFAVWRLLRGEILIGLVDLAILAGIIGAMVYAWRTNRTGRAGLLLAIFPCTGGAITISLLAGEVGLFWLYPALICSFMLTRPIIAAALPLTALSLLLIEGSAFQSTQHVWSFSITLLVVCACTYAFARRGEDQRNRLEHLALLDPLTGAGNRRALDETLARAIAKRERYGHQFGLVLTDLDHFKIVNDEHGHSIGDRLLVEFVDILTFNTRRMDEVFRFGGEEFVILMPGSTPNGLWGSVENLQALIHNRLASPSGPVTASFGIAMLQDGESADEWLVRTDKALYQAKERGRDCIVSGDLPHQESAV